MPTFGTVAVYEEIAALLNADQEWLEIGKNITYTMVYEYSEPANKAFFLRFESGKITEVRELGSADEEPADFVLTGAPEVWRNVMESKVNPKLALLKGQLKVKGSMSTLMKQMKPLSYILETMTQIQLV